MELFRQAFGWRFVTHPSHAGLFTDVFRYRCKWSLEIRGCDCVAREEVALIRVQLLPHLGADDAIGVHLVRLFISLDRSHKIVSVSPVNLARRETGAIEQDLSTNDARLRGLRSDFGRVGAVFDRTNQGAFRAG